MWSYWSNVYYDVVIGVVCITVVLLTTSVDDIMRWFNGYIIYVVVVLGGWYVRWIIGIVIVIAFIVPMFPVLDACFE